MSDNLQEKLLAELALFFEPLESASEDPARLYALFRSTGWNLEAVLGANSGPFTADITAIATAVAAIREWTKAPPETLGQLQQAFQTTEAAVAAIRRLPSTIKGVQPTITGIDDLALDLLELLTLLYLVRRAPRLYGLLVLTTVIEDKIAAAVVVDGKEVRAPSYTPRLQFQQLGALIRDPVSVLKSRYAPQGLIDDTTMLSIAATLFPPLANLLQQIGADAVVGRGCSPRQLTDDVEKEIASMLTATWMLTIADGSTAEFGATVSLVPADKGGPGLFVAPFGSVEFEQTLSAWLFRASVTPGLDAFIVSSSGLVIVPSAGASPEKVDIDLAVSRISSSGPLRLGSTTGTRFEVGGFSIGATASLGVSEQDYGLLMEIDSGAIVIAAGDGDGFLQKVLPEDGIRIDFDLGIGWSKRKGIYFHGSAGLEATIPIHQDLFGILTVDSVYLGLLVKDINNQAAIEAIVAATASLKLGPITGMVDRMGLAGKFTFPQTGGNLGPLNLALGFKPPDGAGLSLDASAVVGGGYLFFDNDKGQYGGVLQLEVKGGIAIKAIGLISTKMPDGSPGFSLLVIITVEFSPIALGYGFTLNGVGGLAGFNRTMKVDALRDGIKNRTLDSIMFPPDPIKNAPKIISDLTAVFPPAPGRFVFAPMVELGWGSGILTIAIGLVVELPSPLRLAILGKLHLKLPPLKQDGEEGESKNIVEIHMDVLGILDFDRNEASIDAILYDSRLVLFPITGGMAMRLRWGNDPIFMLSIGGFNPHYTPPPGFPILDRLGLQLNYDKSGLRAKLLLVTYIAVTPNTLQFGARIDAYAEVSAAKIGGYLGFDALIEFSPFHFIVDLYGGVAVKAFSFNFSVDLLLTLSGPKPFIGDGHVIIKFLGTHEVHVHFSIGEEAEPTPALPPVDPLPELLAALADISNWSAVLPNSGSMLVTLRQLSVDEVNGKVLAHPLGELTVRQKVLPFGISLERFGASVPTTPGPFNIQEFTLGTQSPVQATLDIRDAFARGQFENLSEDEKVSCPSFESFECGKSRIGSDAITPGPTQTCAFEYEVTIIDNKEENKKRTLPNASISGREFTRAAQFGAAKQTPMSATGSAKFAGQEQGIKVLKAEFAITGKNDMQVSGTETFLSYTEAEAARRDGSPDDSQVVEGYEVDLGEQ